MSAELTNPPTTPAQAFKTGEFQGILMRHDITNQRGEEIIIRAAAEALFNEEAAIPEEIAAP